MADKKKRKRAPDWLRFNDPNMGLPLLLLPLVFLSLKKNSKNRNQQLAIFFLISGLVAVFVSTEWFPWYLFSWIANRLQFAWRVLIIAVPLLSFGRADQRNSDSAEVQEAGALSAGCDQRAFGCSSLP